MNFSRRTFLKSAGAATAGIAAVTSMPKKMLSWAEDTAQKDMKQVPTFCELCFWNCGLVAKVENGKVVKVDGNPLSLRGRGRLCGRGNAALGALYDPDRLKYPMINTGKRGEPVWKRATWDEALTLIAGKMKGIKEKYGAESMALIYHGTGASFWKHLLHAYGSTLSAAPSFAQCRGPRDVGFYLTYGSDVGSPEYYDFSKSKYIVLFGSHLGENAHNSQVQDIVSGLADGAKMTVVDPRLSNIASKADHWLPIKPATDLALILAWIRLLIEEGLYDKEYVAKYATGFDGLRAAVQQYTPEWAETETTIPKEMIVKVAREMAKQAPHVCVGAGRYAAWYGDDVQRSRGIAILNALLGSWGRKGGYFFPTGAKVPEYPGLPAYPEHEEVAKLDGAYPYAALQTTTSIRQASSSGKPRPVKAWFVYGSNLMKTMPEKQETIKAIQSLDLLVTIDTMPMDIINYSDVVLPECTYLERHDNINVGKFNGEAEIAIRQPAVEPLWESKPSWWMVKELGSKLGLAEYFPWKNGEEYIAKRCEAGGIDYAQLKRDGVIIKKGGAPYITADSQPEFGTPSGKIELYSEQLAEKGFDPVPKYTKHPQPAAGQFRLLFGRSPLHTFSRTTNNFMLTDLQKENHLWLNARKGKELGVKDGDYVFLENQDGVRSPGRIKVKLTQRLRDDVVYMYHGFGVHAKAMTRADNRGIADDDLITKSAVDPIMGGTSMRGNFVKIVKGA
ncbi:molybdopterin-containing oxidoreductase family protein [Trichlorobacter ammonificans]|uniref:Polysulfide reductase chain A n=1 Tax=Trichlorobacter ammonificans TaxID=2916410 RepID=A0ABM9D702_9BACT|nr:molybdopterin-dependent oxidoreductase [Trichlorobacter ammonificans]CAH2030974.1 putative Polysulfide reductase chain A [Trichlorobacter ammonificans]